MYYHIIQHEHEAVLLQTLRFQQLGFQKLLRNVF